MDRDFWSWLVLGNRKHFRGERLAPKSLSQGKLYPIMGVADAKAANASAHYALLCKPGYFGEMVALYNCIRTRHHRARAGHIRYYTMLEHVNRVLVPYFCPQND